MLLSISPMPDVRRCSVVGASLYPVNSYLPSEAIKFIIFELALPKYKLLVYSQLHFSSNSFELLGKFVPMLSKLNTLKSSRLPSTENTHKRNNMTCSTSFSFEYTGFGEVAKVQGSLVS